MTSNYDPKPGRWMLPLVVLAMVAFTYLFVRELPSAASANEGGELTGTTTLITTSTTGGDETTTTTGAVVDATTQAYLDSLTASQSTLSNLQTELASANAGWDANPKTITFDQAEEAFISVAEGAAVLVGEVQAATVPADLIEAHNAVIAAAQQAADAASRALAGLRAPSPDTGEGRRAAVNDFDAAVTAFNDAVAAVTALRRLNRCRSTESTSESRRPRSTRPIASCWPAISESIPDPMAPRGLPASGSLIVPSVHGTVTRWSAPRSAFSLQLTVPGAIVATGGTTMVSVAPTHRRKGILREMMTAHLEDVAARGEPLAALWASESSIYGRFGYGVAAQGSELRIPRQYSNLHRLAPAPAPIRLVDEKEARRHFPAIYERVAAWWPGFFARSEAWWEERWFKDPPDRRQGASALRFAMTTSEDGYVIYRQKHKFEQGNSSGGLTVVDLLGTSPESWAGLWSFILNHDLPITIEAFHRSTIDPIFDLLESPRQMKERRADSLWIRTNDPAAALASRRYQTEGELVLEIVDPFHGSEDGARAGRRTGRCIVSGHRQSSGSGARHRGSRCVLSGLVAFSYAGPGRKDRRRQELTGAGRSDVHLGPTPLVPRGVLTRGLLTRGLSTRGL